MIFDLLIVYPALRYIWLVMCYYFATLANINPTSVLGVVLHIVLRSGKQRLRVMKRKGELNQIPNSLPMCTLHTALMFAPLTRVVWRVVYVLSFFSIKFRTRPDRNEIYGRNVRLSSLLLSYFPAFYLPSSTHKPAVQCFSISLNMGIS